VASVAPLVDGCGLEVSDRILEYGECTSEALARSRVYDEESLSSLQQRVDEQIGECGTGDDGQPCQ
jgi:hypothetical protein